MLTLFTNITTEESKALMELTCTAAYEYISMNFGVIYDFNKNKSQATKGF